MPREYRHMEEYEEEIIRLYEEGTTLREIGKKFGKVYLRKQQVKISESKSWKDGNLSPNIVFMISNQFS